MLTFSEFLFEDRQKFMHPDEIQTERPMSMAGNTHEILTQHAAGKMPLDKKKVKAIEKVLKSGKTVPPLKIKNGILQDGHHRLQAYRNLKYTSVPVEHK